MAFYNQTNCIITTLPQQLDRPSFGVGSNELGVLLDAGGSDRLIRAYRKYMEEVIGSLSEGRVAKATIQQDLDDLFQFIVRLTQIVTPADEKRDHFSVYKRMTLQQLETEHPGVSDFFE
jgi:predicted metalloendopeptidase